MSPWTSECIACHLFFPELNEPARPAATRPVSRDMGAGRRRVGARCVQSDEDKIGGNRKIGVAVRPKGGQ